MAPTSYATPGVYVEEISTLPPSIAEIGTAIPAFIGTTTAHDASKPVVAQEINSLREFEDRYGSAPATEWKVSFQADPEGFVILDGQDKPVGRFSEPASLLWYAIDLYFRNGGSRCYILSVGVASAATPPTAQQFLAGLDALERYDEPTLVLIPEVSKLSPADYGSVCKAALQHAAKLKDRFVLLDAKPSPGNGLASADMEAMREPLGMDHLDRGALYFPFLLTTLAHQISEERIQVLGLPGAASATPAGAEGGKGSSSAGSKAATQGVSLPSLATTQTIHYNQIKKLLGEQRVILPPSAAIAGVVASVDRERGVWKAPANVGLQAVIAPVVQVTDEQQALLNIDPTTGKSINAIRSFAGKGPLVWGARTLAGNDNEWRYISVRRLFITVEESVKKATAFAVFEANDTSTWLKVKGMIDSYLYTLWERGALRGAKAEEAYFVNVGLNKTMTMDDILNGRLIVEIGLAAVRPAEFIILRFSHKVSQ
ncbi:MAG: phage tail sheath C-terminal domain-containing protein [Cyanobacteriota bacterium]|nr:phage tail sheath C-terminal domain-containing protein [Cyanobacteriota bacterium]